MHRLLSSLALLVAFSAAADPGDELLARLEHFLANAHVIEVHRDFWAEELVYTSSDGRRFGKAAILEGMAADAGEASLPTRYRAENIGVRSLERAAVVTFVLVGEEPGGERARYYNTGVFTRRDGRWRAIAWQATRAAAD